MSETPQQRQPLAEQGPNAHNIGTTSASSLKRTYDDVADDSDDEYPVTENCDQIRRKLQNFINTGEMKLGELHKALGVSGKSFNTFMGQHGKFKGDGTATYPAASTFFKKREAKGIKIPAKRVKKSEEKKVDLSDVKLDGEESASVPIFDSCDEVRKKIRAHLRDPGVTQAGFMREIAKMYPQEKKVQAKQLNTFLGQHGPLTGNGSAVYYAGYVYFEKLRVKENKPQSKHRQEMEKRHPQGVDTQINTRHILCPAGVRPYFDAYGSLHMAPSGRK